MFAAKVKKKKKKTCSVSCYNRIFNTCILNLFSNGPIWHVHLVILFTANNAHLWICHKSSQPVLGQEWDDHSLLIHVCLCVCGSSCDHVRAVCSPLGMVPNCNKPLLTVNTSRLALYRTTIQLRKKQKKEDTSVYTSCVCVWKRVSECVFYYAMLYRNVYFCNVHQGMS